MITLFNDLLFDLMCEKKNLLYFYKYPEMYDRHFY